MDFITDRYEIIAANQAATASDFALVSLLMVCMFALSGHLGGRRSNESTKFALIGAAVGLVASLAVVALVTLIS